MPLSKSHGGLGLEHFHAEILIEIQFTVMSLKDPLSKVLQEISGWGAGRSSVSALKSLWFCGK